MVTTLSGFRRGILERLQRLDGYAQVNCSKDKPPIIANQKSLPRKSESKL